MNDKALSDEDKADVFEVLMWETVQRLFKVLGGDKTKLSTHERHIVALWRLEVDTYNGGIEQFICNWGFDEVLLAQRVLGDIGAAQALALLTQAQAVFADVAPDDVDNLWGAMALFSDAQRDELDSIN